MFWVEKLVGASFLEKFAPKKGRTLFLILGLLFLTILVVDLVTLRYRISQSFAESKQLTETIKFLMDSGETDQENINQFYQKKMELLTSVSKSRGIVNQAHHKFPFVQINSFFNKI